MLAANDAHGAAVSPDGRYFYYWTGAAAGRPALQRLDLGTFRREELAVFDQAVPGQGRPLRTIMHGYAAIRSDGRRLCVGANFGAGGGPVSAGGRDEPPNHFAPIFVNLDTLAVHSWDWEPYSWRVGGSYFPGDDPQYRELLLMGKANRSQHWDAQGKYSEQWYSDVHRSSLHVVREDGTIAATVPIGDAKEGVDHPGWRGGVYEVVTHTSDFKTAAFWRGALFCARPVACAPAHQQDGCAIPGGRRWDLTRYIRRPDICHHSWTPDGRHFVADTEGWHHRGTPAADGLAAYLWLGTVVDTAGGDPYVITRYLLHPRSSWNSAFTENCPVVSPDGTVVCFNSDWLGKYGQPQVFAVRGFRFPAVTPGARVGGG